MAARIWPLTGLAHAAASPETQGPERRRPQPGGLIPEPLLDVGGRFNLGRHDVHVTYGTHTHRYQELNPYFGSTLSVSRQKLVYVSVLVMLLSFYATKVYGRLKPMFGGGLPMAVRLYVKEVNPIIQEGIVDAFLVDENSNGYHIVRTRDSKHAVFIARGAVSAVEFREQLRPTVKP